MEMIFSGSTMKRSEVKHAGRRIESALDAVDCQAASMCLRLTHDEVFSSVREALRDERAMRWTRSLRISVREKPPFVAEIDGKR